MGVFDLYTFDNETMALLKVFETSREINFLSLFFLNERNITSPLLMMHLKCVVFHCANLNSGSINKVYLRAIEFAISISSRFFIYVSFKIKKYHFLMQISKIDYKMQYVYY